MAAAEATPTTVTGAAVIDERMLREGIYIEGNIRPGLGDDAAQPKSSSGPSAFAARAAKAATARGGVGALAAVTGAGPSSFQRAVDLHEVECLMLSYRRISSIQNLVGVQSLTKLHLDNNSISTIENLSHLTHLKWLDLSFNRITRISGLDALVDLEDLSLHNNQISIVEGLDQNMKLTCLSLGRNQIDGIDDVARYLHRFKRLRMLTLAGNRVEQQAHYRQRLLGYVPRLRYLDSRSVSEAEVTKAKDDLKEQLLPVDEEDRKAEEQQQQARAAAEDAVRYAKTNCPNETTFHREIASLEPEGRNLSALFEIDVVRDRLKDIPEAHANEFSVKAKSLFEAMSKLRVLKDDAVNDYYATLTKAKARSDGEGKLAIAAFEKRMKAVIPFGLRARPDPDTYDENQVNQLHASLQSLKSLLLEMEADQQDAFEALNKAFEDTTDKLRADAIEVLSSHFDELRVLEKTMFNQLTPRFDAWYDERTRQAQDAAEGYGSGAADGGHPRDKQALAMMDNREDFMKTLHEWHELHIKRLDEREEYHKRREEEWFKALQSKHKETEHKRNRLRVGEIAAYCARVEDQLQQWSSWAEWR